MLAEGEIYTVRGYNAYWNLLVGGLSSGFSPSRFFKVVKDAAPAPAASGYPDDNPKTVVGLTKPSLASVPPIALFKIGQAMSDGARKYGRFNWRENAVTASVYYDAAMRHMMAWHDGEDVASDSGVDHLAHAAACLAIVMDAAASGKLNDDRGPRGSLAQFIAESTKAAA